MRQRRIPSASIVKLKFQEIRASQYDIEDFCLLKSLDYRFRMPGFGESVDA